MMVDLYGFDSFWVRIPGLLLQIDCKYIKTIKMSQLPSN